MTRKDEPVGLARGALVEASSAAEPAALIARCARGDQLALARLYDATAAQVNGLALRILGDHQAAEEITEDVFVQVWSSSATYDPGRGSALAWLFTLARSRAIDRLRATSGERRRTEPLDADMDAASADAGPEEGSSLAERRRLVRSALGGLAREQREAIELAFFRGLTHTEIAALVGAPLGTIKTRIRLGMGRLRDALAARGGFTS